MLFQRARKFHVVRNQKVTCRTLDPVWLSAVEQGSQVGSEPLLPIGQYVADASQINDDVKEASEDLSEVTPLTTTAPLKEDEVEMPEEWHSPQMPAHFEALSRFQEAPQPVIKPKASHKGSPRAGSKRSGGRGSGRKGSSSHRSRREEEEDEEEFEHGRMAEQYGSDDENGLREQTYLTEQVALQQQRVRAQGPRQSQQAQYEQAIREQAIRDQAIREQAIREQAIRYSAPEPQRRGQPVDYSEYAQAARPSHSPKHAAMTQPSSSLRSKHRSHGRDIEHIPAAEQEGERFENVVEAQRPARKHRSVDAGQAVVSSASGERDTEGRRRVWSEGNEAPGSPMPREERRGRSHSNRHVAPSSRRSDLSHSAEVLAEDDDLAAEALDEDEGAVGGANDPRVNRRRRRRAQDD